jgi:cytochrome P450
MPLTYEDRKMGDNAEFYADFLDYRYDHPGDDLITRLITAEFTDENGIVRTLTRDEALMYVNVVSGAGNHTTNRLISWTAKVLAENPDARRDVVADRSLVPNVIEETLRFEPPSTQIASNPHAASSTHGRGTHAPSTQARRGPHAASPEQTRQSCPSQ